MKNNILGLLLLAITACGGGNTVEKEIPLEKPPIQEKSLNLEVGVDDYNSLKYLLKYIHVINSYGVKITYYVSGYEESIKSDLLMLQNMGHEIANHTQNHYYAPSYIKNNSTDKYVENVLHYNQKLLDAGIEVNKFAYPFGAGNPEVDKILKDHFDKVRYTTKDYDEGVSNSLFPKAINIDGYNLDLDKVRVALQKGIDTGEQVTFLFHAITEDYGDQFYITPEELVSFLEVVIEYQ